MRTYTLSEKLSLNFISLCLISVALVGIYSYYSAKNALINRTYQQLTSVRIEKQTQLEQYFYERIADFNLACQVFSKNDKNQNQNNLLDDILQSITNKEKSVKAFCVFDISPTGEMEVLFKTANSDFLFNTIESKIHDIKRSIPPTSLENTRIIDYQQYGDGNYLTVIRQLPNKQNRYAIMLLSPISINTIMLEDNFNRGLGSTGEAYLIGHDSLMRSGSRFIGNSFLTTKVITRAAVNALGAESGTVTAPDYRNTPVMSSYGRIAKSGIQWGILAEIDQGEAMKQIVSLRNDILLMSLSLSVLVFALVIIMAHRITSPLAHLKNGLGKIGEGNLNLNLPIESNDEIGQLTQSFNEMAKKLQEQQANLIEHEARLKHFYDATQEGIILHNNNILLEVNRAFKNLSGYKSSDTLHLTIPDLIIQKQENADQRAAEALLRKKDGSLLAVEIQSGTIRILDQTVGVTVIRDISERKQSEKFIKEERQRQLQYVIDGQEQERQRLSRELHDGIGQQLIATKLRLELFDADTKERETFITGVKDEINRLIDDVRRISNNLMPSVLIELDLTTALQNLCNGFCQGKGESITCTISNLPEKMDIRQKNYIFRIIQEALTNAVKHSGAKEINLFANVIDNTINIHIKDNGKGFDPEKIIPHGNGMINMRERANLLGGEFRFESSLGHGSDIYVRIPLKDDHNTLI